LPWEGSNDDFYGVNTRRTEAYATISIGSRVSEMIREKSAVDVGVFADCIV